MDKRLGGRTELLFLNGFKHVLLFIMGLALVGAVGFAAFSVARLLESPVEPPPIQEPPAQPIRSEGFLDLLKQQVKPTEKIEPGAQDTKTTDAAHRQKFLDYAKSLGACSREFSKSTVQDVLGSTVQDDQARAEVLGDVLAHAERAGKLGEDWGPALVTFACDALRNPQLAEFKKKHPETSTFMPLLEYHRRAWIENRSNANEFRVKEQARVADARRSEEIRVEMAKQQALVMMGIAGGLLGLFGLLALYLIFARIELNLRSIAESLPQGRHEATSAA